MIWRRWELEMLLERAAKLGAEIERYQKLKAAVKESSLVSTRANQIGEAAALLAQARVALAKFSDAGISIQYAPIAVQELTEKATKLRAIAADDPAGLAEPPFNISHEFTNRLKGLANAANDSIEEGWGKYVAANSPSSSDEVLEALGKLPQMSAGVNRIRQCRQQVAVLADTVPEDPAVAVEQLGELSTEHGAAWVELTASDVPPSVLQFLRDCAADGALFTALSNEVRGWLEERELLGSFRIRIG
jgi:hypothetical protein